MSQKIFPITFFFFLFTYLIFTHYCNKNNEPKLDLNSLQTQQYILGKINGKEMYEKDLPKREQQKLLQLKKRLLYKYYETLNTAMEEKVLKLEAKKRSLSKSSLIEEVLNISLEPEKQEVLNFYYKWKNRFPGSFSENKKAIIKNIRMGKTRLFQHRAFAKLLTNYKIENKIRLPKNKLKINSEKDIVLGNNKAKIKVIEFCGFFNRACASLQKGFQEIRKKYSSKLVWIIKNLPNEKNPIEWAVHSLGLCAYKQKKYSELALTLFNNIDKIKPSFQPSSEQSWLSAYQKAQKYYYKLANAENLVMPALKKCMNDYKILDNQIEEDIRQAWELSVFRKPTLFVNGLRLELSPEATEDIDFFIWQLEGLIKSAMRESKF